MLSKNRLSGLLAVCAALPLTAAMMGPAAAPPNRLAGSWEVVGTPDPVSGIPPFLNFTTFDGDGSIVNIDPSVGTGVGRSARSGPMSYDTTFFGFLDAGGPATYKVTSTLTLAGPDAFSGPFLTEVFDLNGEFLFSYTGAVSGMRQTQ